MSHISIAIIRRRKSYNLNTEISVGTSSSTKKNDTGYIYLVHQVEREEYKFFDIKSKTINGEFDYSLLKTKVLDFYKLNAPEINSDNQKYVDTEEFEESYLYDTNGRNPYATAYMFTLSEQQTKRIESCIDNNSNSNKWKNLIWVDEKNILNKETNWVKYQKFLFNPELPFEFPDFPKELRASLRNIVRARNTGKLVIFAGAGVSVDSLVPLWGELIEGLSFDLDKTASDSLKLAQLYFNSRKNKEFQERVQEILKYGKTQYNPLHQKIVDIKPNHIITTNYDEHFEQVLDGSGYKYSIIKKDYDLPYSKGASLFIKMHGDFAERNIVLKSKDYDSYSEVFPLIEGFVKGIFASKLVLFVGFSFDDPNIQGIYNSVDKILDEDIQPPYFFLTDIDNKSITKLEQEFKFKIVDGGKKKSKTAISQYFERIAKSDDRENLKSLSIKGKETYKFLSVLNSFDLILGSFDGESIENQFIYSLERFKDFGAIPKKILENIAPFKYSHRAIDDTAYSGEFAEERNFVLRTPNEDFLDYLKSYSDVNDSITFYSYPDDNRSLREQRLDNIWKLLWMSGVNGISRKKDTSSEKYKLRPVNKEEGCNCAKCRYERLELGELLSDLTVLSDKLICNSSFESIGLTEAFGYFKTGQIVKAYNTLEEVKNNSLKLNRHVLYFLATYNQYLLNPFLTFFNCRNIDADELARIKERIKSINLNSLLYELPVDNDVKKSLTIIYNDSLIHKAEKIIRKNHKDILEIYNGYKKGTYTHYGPSYWYIVEHEFVELWRFYFQNSLFSVEYSPFFRLARKYVESVIAAYCTDNRYEGKPKLVGYFLVLSILEYHPPKLTREIFKKYNLGNIEIYHHKEKKKELLTLFNSFIESAYVEKEFFGHTISKNHLFEQANRNSKLFQNRNSKIINNFLLIISHLDYNSDEFSQIIKKALKHMQMNSVLHLESALDSLKYLIIKKHQHISVELIIEIFCFALDNALRVDAYIPAISSVLINDKQAKKAINQNSFKKIVERFKKEGSLRQKFAIVSIFNLLSNDKQDEFRDIIFKEIIDYEDNEHLTTCYYWGIWNPENNADIFKVYVKNLIRVSKNYPDIELNDEGIPIGNLSFHGWNDLINFTFMVYKYNLFENEYVKKVKKNIKSSMFKWALAPLEYNYKEFDVKWLTIFNNKYHLKVFNRSKELKETLMKELQGNYNKDAAKVYFSLCEMEDKE